MRGVGHRFPAASSFGLCLASRILVISRVKAAGSSTCAFADEYARRTVGLPSATHVPDIEAALRVVLPKLEARMIEFLAEWLVTLLIPATHVLEVRASFLCVTQRILVQRAIPWPKSHGIF